jgi:signal peptidase II
MKNLWLIPLIALLVVVADVASKLWALASLTEGTTVQFIPGFIQLTLTTNTGGAFGILRQYKELMMILPICICLGIIYWIVRRTRSGSQFSRWEQIAYGLVLGGAAGNISERLWRGHVTDFLDFAFMDFPIFNVADALIDVGVAIIIIHSVVSGQSKPSEQASANE